MCRVAALLFLILLAPMASLPGQSVLTPRNMALGGGGTAYINDHNANFINPANLLIRDKERALEISGPTLSLFVDHPLYNGELLNAWNTFSEQYFPYQPGEQTLAQADLPGFVEDNYPGQDRRANYRSRMDIQLFGITYKSENRAWSLALRRRSSNSYEVGRGWFDLQPVTDGSSRIVDRSLIHRHQTLYELSFGLAESFTFLNGITSRLDNFSIGIAPKLVIGGRYQDASWNNEYRQSANGNGYTRFQSFNVNAAGRYGEAFLNTRNGQNYRQVTNTLGGDPYFSFNGIGAGLDIGVTYLLTLGSDLSAIRSGQQTTRSVRLSLSITDIGLVRYTNDQQQLSIARDTTSGISALPFSEANEVYTGAPGQFIYFTDRFAEDDPVSSALVNNNSYSILLPLAMNAGAMLELNRIKLVGDLRFGLTNNAFHRNILYSSFGMELRPFNVLAVRGGMRFSGSAADFLSVGTELDMKRWSIALSAQFLPSEITSRAIITGYSAAALRFHF